MYFNVFLSIMKNHLFVNILGFIIVFDITLASKVPIKIALEPLSQNNLLNPIVVEMKPKFNASGFSGPPHLQWLVGKCFSKDIQQYKFNFCPFQNITQHETISRWNAYNGILGIWHSWKIVNNTFSRQQMQNGDDCNDKQTRETDVELICGPTNSIVEVREPVTCRYQVQFSTPLVCHPDSLLVYPVLNDSQQHSWDELETNRVSGTLTNNEYKQGLQEIFDSAGFIQKTSSPNANDSPSKNSKCKTELEEKDLVIKRLRKTIQSLRKDLATTRYRIAT